MDNIFFTLIFAVFFQYAVNAQSAYLDPGFGAGGIVLPEELPKANFRRTDLELQPDGKILALDVQKNHPANTKVQIQLHRFLQDGTLDAGFGTGGTVQVQSDIFNLGFLDGVAVHLLSDGKILVGYFELPASDSTETTVVRFLENGSPDAGFGINGSFKIKDFWSAATNVAFLRDIQVQPSGQLVLTYHSTNSHRDNYGFRFLDPAGNTLPGYEQIQWANTNNRAEVYVKTLIQPDNKILVGGYLDSYNNNAADKKIILERFNADATFDTSFAAQGIAVLDITPSTDYLSGMVLEADGGIVVTGSDLSNRLFFAKFLPNGAPDSTFGSAGILLRENTTHFYANPIMEQAADGHLLVTGIKGAIGPGQETFPSIARLDADGGFDLTFSPDGTIFLPKDGIERQVILEDMISMPDRRIVVGGYAADDSLQQLLLVRFMPELNATAWYPDADTDGFGFDAGVLFADQQPLGYVAVGGDCDDQDAGVNPGATEICGNGKDDNCDGISLEDTSAPLARCKQNYKISLDETGSVSINPQDLDDGSSDDCGTLQFSASKTVFDCSNLYINFDTLTVTDNAGNQRSCLAVVKISDLVAPVAQCQPILKPQLDINGRATISVADVDAGSYDNCAITNLRIDQTEFRCSDIGIHTVTLMVEDVFGNAATCESIVKVSDQMPPTVICVEKTTIALNASGAASLTANQVDLGSYDNCSPSLQYRLDRTTFSCADLGIPQFVTLTVEDESSNTNACQVEVTVSDKIAPVIVCVEKITLALDNNGLANLDAAALDAGSYDNCGGNLEFGIENSIFDCNDLGINTAILKVGDPSGNYNECLTEVTIEDKIAPTAVCRDTLVMVLNDADEVEIFPGMLDGGSFDNCDTLIYQANPSFFTLANLGFNNAVLTVSDLSGNQSSCNLIIEVVQQTLSANDPAAWDVKVFPNPSTGFFSLQVASGQILTRAEVFNAAGRLVWQKAFDSKGYELDLSNQAAGCYYLRLQAGDAVRMMKLSVLR